MSKDNNLLTLKLDDQQIDSGLFFYILLADMRGSRALFVPTGHPAQEQFPMPICSTALETPDLFKSEKVKALWLGNEHFDLPHHMESACADGEYYEVDCSKCQYNKFGSEASFDSKKSDSRGKACKESRHQFVRIMRKGAALPPLPSKEELFFFENDDKYPTFVRLPMGLGSHSKVIEQMGLAAKARGVSLRSLVFKIGVRIESPTPSVKYPVAVRTIVEPSLV